MSFQARIENIIRTRIKRGLTAVAVAFLTDLKKTVSVPAPRRRTASGKIVATTPATPGAPPRVVTGRGRSSLSMKLDIENNRAIIRVGAFYMMVHEDGNHPWLQKTWDANNTRYQELFRRYLSGES